MRLAPTLTTERLTLRPFVLEDYPYVYKWCSSLRCAEFLFWLPHRDEETTEKIVAKWVRKRRNYSWALVHDGVPIGEVEVIKDLPDGGFELGYILVDGEWGRGYMSEALKAILPYLFSSGYEYCFAETDARNEKSQHLLAKMGFSYLETEKGRLIEKKNERVDVAKYRLDK
jgi:RimJ/RimL family protein N-acetyltransferase